MMNQMERARQRADETRRVRDRMEGEGPRIKWIKLIGLVMRRKEEPLEC
jgi:hypothetical protein